MLFKFDNLVPFIFLSRASRNTFRKYDFFHKSEIKPNAKGKVCTGGVKDTSQTTKGSKNGEVRWENGWLVSAMKMFPFRRVECGLSPSFVNNDVWVLC